MVTTMILSIILIFLVLAAQFESFRDPFIIILGSVPLALAGALLFTFLGATSINIYSQVGLITLVGLVAKNGILIVEFANNLQEGGLDKWHAILAAADIIHEPFAMINADDFYGADTFRVLADYLRHVQPDSNSYAMVGFTLRKTLSDHGTVARGVCQVDNAGKLKQIVELLKIEKTGTGARQGEQLLTGDEPVSMNFWGFTPTLFSHLRTELQQFLQAHGQEEKSELLIPTVIGGLITQGRATCQVLRTTASWFGVTYREDRPIVIESVRQLIANGEYPAKLWE